MQQARVHKTIICPQDVVNLDDKTHALGQLKYLPLYTSETSRMHPTMFDGVRHCHHVSDSTLDHVLIQVTSKRVESKNSLQFK